MAFYHGTWRQRLPVIEQEGLRAHESQNFDCEPGVYLAASPAVSLAMLLEAGVKNLRHETPQAMLDDLIVIVIDDARVDPSRLKVDVPHSDPKMATWRYQGVIDIGGMPVLDFKQVVG